MLSPISICGGKIRVSTSISTCLLDLKTYVLRLPTCNFLRIFDSYPIDLSFYTIKLYDFSITQKWKHLNPLLFGFKSSPSG